ncbi:MAG: hypothetical protein QG567_1314, partial [Campylobacterota bacterium]|nr:hypothetical protein [Campylobacterota bacterium]
DKMIDKIEQSAKELEQYKKALNEIDIVSKSDLDGNITYVNQKFCDSTGYARQELIGRPHNIIRHPDMPKEVFKELWETIRAKKTWKKTIKNRKKNGDYYWVDVMIMPILDSKNEIIEYIAARHDVTELIDQRKELETLISTDTLTGLGNRFRLVNDIQSSLSPSLALINIDNFREINDFYGHKIGDFVIIELGNLIFERFNSNDYNIYHIQGDEYAILYQKDDKANFYKKVEEATLSIGSSDVEISIHKITMQLTASISFEDKSSLLTTVDMALKYAKKSRKNIIVYDKTLELDKEYKKNIEWTIKLKNAINNDRITVFYQPIINNKDGRMEKYECLVRMIDEDGKVISPYFFLDIAKRAKLYTKITEKVIEKSFEEFKDKDCEFSINLNIQDILDKNLIKYLNKMIKDYNIEGRLVFEIVENEGIENFDEVKQFIKNAKSCGCKVAIDDFGTGYSNFEYLMQLEADYIKIDGSMIKNIITNKNSKLVVETIVDFAKKMNIKTIAEFVKDEEVYKKVKELGIDYSQGYHLGEPSQNPN